MSITYDEIYTYCQLKYLIHRNKIASCICNYHSALTIAELRVSVKSIPSSWYTLNTLKRENSISLTFSESPWLIFMILVHSSLIVLQYFPDCWFFGSSWYTLHIVKRENLISLTISKIQVLIYILLNVYHEAYTTHSDSWNTEFTTTTLAVYIIITVHMFRKVAQKFKLWIILLILNWVAI